MKLHQTLYRGLVRNNDLRVPMIDTRSTIEWIALSKFQYVAGIEEPMEPILTRPLMSDSKPLYILSMCWIVQFQVRVCFNELFPCINMDKLGFIHLHKVYRKCLINLFD